MLIRYRWLRILLKNNKMIYVYSWTLNFLIKNYITKFGNIFKFNLYGMQIVICPKPLPTWFVFHVTYVVSFWFSGPSKTSFVFNYWYSLIRTFMAKRVPKMKIKILNIAYLFVIYLMFTLSVDLILLLTRWNPSSVSIPLVRMMVMNLASSEFVIDVCLVFFVMSLQPSWHWYPNSDCSLKKCST